MTAPTPQPDAERVQGEVTAAVRRAAKSHYAAKVSAAGNNWPAWDDAPVRWRQMTTWEVQAVGRDLLDVEEMARAALPYIGTFEGLSINEQNFRRGIATNIRAAILGADQ